MKKRVVSLALAVLMLFALAPTFSVEAAAADTVNVSNYSYSVQPILSPFCYCVYVKTDNPDPTSFRLIDRSSVYDDDSAHGYYTLSERLFADVKYEDKATYRVKGGYIFVRDGDGYPDGGTLILQQKSGNGYQDTSKKISCAKLKRTQDYLIDTYTTSSMSFFEKMDAVQSGLNKIAVYPHGVYDTDSPSEVTPYPFLATSPYRELSLNEHYEMYDRYDGGILLQYAYPFVLDSLGVPGTMRNVAKALDSAAEVTGGDYHYSISVTYKGETRSYGGAGSGGYDPIYTNRVKTSFLFSGSSSDLALNGTIDKYYDQYWEYNRLSVEDSEQYADLIEGETFTKNIQSTGGTWMRVGSEPWILGNVPPRVYSYAIPRGDSSYRILSEAWVDGRYVGPYERFVFDATFEDYPDADIVIRQMQYTDEDGVQHKQDVLFSYDSERDLWDASDYYYTHWYSASNKPALPDAFDLTRSEVKKLGVDANTSFYPTQGLIYDGSVQPGTAFKNTSVTGISVPKTATLGIGESKTITATLSPSNATNQTVSWYSDNEDVATVSRSYDSDKVNQGTIYGKAPGQATITALAWDGSFTATCKVTVKAEGTYGETTFSFDAESGQMTISGTGKMDDYSKNGASGSIPWLRLRDQIKSVVIEDGVTYVGRYVFADCPNLKKVTIGSGAAEVDETAFANSGVTAYSVSKKNQTYTTVGGVLFSKDKTELVSFPSGKSGAYTIPDGVTRIGYYAFCICPKVTSVSIPASVYDLQYASFSDCPKLTSFTVNQNNAYYASSGGVLFSKDKTRLIRYPQAKTGAYSVPTGTTSLGAYSFSNCSGLTSVSMPLGLTSVGHDAFDSCSALKRAVLSKDTTSISSYAFEYCTALTTVFIPVGVQNLYYTFYGCKNLKSVYYGGTESQWSEIDVYTSSYDTALDNATIYYSSVFLTAQPTGASAAVGSTAAFTVKATGSGLKYQWQYKTPDGSWTDCTSKTTGYHKATLKVEAAEKRNGYQYRCKVTDSNGGYVYSKAAKLTVKSISITTQPKAAAANVGETATFTVKASGSGLKYQWQYKAPDGSWTNCTSKTTGYNKVTLKVEATEKRNGYQYRCKVTDDAKNTVTSKAVKLTVQKLAITTQPKAAAVKSGDTASFTVKATGVSLKYQWQYLKPNGSWTNCTSKTTGYNKATLKVEGVTDSTNRNGYKYRCKVTDSAGSTVTSSAAALSVLAFSKQPASATIAASGTAAFKVTATGSGLKYQWQYLKPNGTWTNCSSKTTGYNKATLKVEGITGSTNRSGYKYRCKVTDSAGNTITSKAVKLTVTTLKITTQPKAASVKTTAYATFTVKATGSGLKYQWQYKKPSGSWTNCSSKTTGYHSATLKVQGVTDGTNRNGYQYRCVITDGSGAKVTSSAVKLSVLAITTQPKAASVSKSGTATFTVKATGSSLKYQWQYLKPNGSWTNCTSATTGYHSATLKVQGVTGSTNRSGYKYRCVITDGAGNKLTTNAAALSVR